MAQVSRSSREGSGECSGSGTRQILTKEHEFMARGERPDVRGRLGAVAEARFELDDKSWLGGQSAVAVDLTV